MKSFEHFEFFQNYIITRGMQQLFLSLKENKDLQVLKINDNFTKTALSDLIKILPGFTKLKINDISDCITEEKLGNKLGLDLFKDWGATSLTRHISLSTIENLKKFIAIIMK